MYIYIHIYIQTHTYKYIYIYIYVWKQCASWLSSRGLCGNLGTWCIELLNMLNYENVWICKEVFLKKAIAETPTKMVVFYLFNLWKNTIVLKFFYICLYMYICRFMVGHNKYSGIANCSWTFSNRYVSS